MPIRRFSSRLAPGIAAGLLLAAPALAQVPLLSFSGYGTVGAVHSDNDRGDYLIDPSRPSGPGHTHAWSYDVDSRLGGQVSAQFSPRLSGVVQVIVQQRYDESWEPTVEWANLKLEIVDGLSVRVGRVVLPVFNVTDSRRIGYAYPWGRPPVEVYSLVPITSSDGLDVSWRAALGEATASVDLNLGKTDSKYPEGGRAEGRNLALVAATVEYGAATLRASYGRTNLSVPAFDPLTDAFRQFGPAGVAIAERYSVQGRRVNFLGFGASYDPERWFVNSEWARFDTHSLLGARSAWYVSAGARVGRFTPYATYARTRPESDTSDPGLSLAGLPPQLAGVAAGLNAALNAQLHVAAQETTSIGVRWDFWRNAALKLQLDHVELGAGSRGLFGNIQPGFQPGGRTRLFSAAIDFVF